MNKYIEAVKAVDLETVKAMLQKDPKWIAWAEPSGKNALHYLCGVRVTGDDAKSDAGLAALKFLLKSGMDINSIHKIDEKNCYFPATPLWYAYTRGRNEKVYRYLLIHGADPRNCWWAIAWYDDVAAGKLWLKHGAVIDKDPTLDELFLGTFAWKKMAFAKWLLDLGADANARGPRGMTALMLAVKRKDEDAVNFLIKAGADPDQRDDTGLSARKIALTKGPKRLLSLLENA